MPCQLNQFILVVYMSMGLCMKSQVGVFFFCFESIFITWYNRWRYWNSDSRVLSSGVACQLVIKAWHFSYKLSSAKFQNCLCVIECLSDHRFGKPIWMQLNMIIFMFISMFTWLEMFNNTMRIWFSWFWFVAICSWI